MTLENALNKINLFIAEDIEIVHFDIVGDKKGLLCDDKGFDYYVEQRKVNLVYEGSFYIPIEGEKYLKVDWSDK